MKASVMQIFVKVFIVAVTFLADLGDSSIFVYEGRQRGPPKATATVDGEEITLEPYGRCISGEKCYDVEDSRKYFMRRFVFVTDEEMSDLKINGHSIAPELDGVFYHSKGIANPVEQFEDKELKRYQSFDVLFVAKNKPKKDYRLSYEFAESVKLGSFEMRLTTDAAPRGIIGMTEATNDFREFVYGCQPAIYPSHLLINFVVYDGDEKVFESTVSRRSPPANMELHEVSQSILYLDPMGREIVVDSSEEETSGEDESTEPSPETYKTYQVILLFPVTDYTQKTLRCTVDGREVIAETDGIPLSQLFSDSRPYVFYWRRQATLRAISEAPLEIDVVDQNGTLLRHLTLSDGAGRYIFDSAGKLFSFARLS